MSRSREFPEAVRAAVLDDASLVRAVLSGVRRGGQVPWIRVAIRPVVVRQGRQLQFVYYSAQTCIAKNLTGDAAASALTELLDAPFRNIHVELTQESVHVSFSRRGRPLVSRGRPSRPHPAPDLTHNRKKERRLPEDDPDPFLEAIGIMTAAGKIRARKERKYRQINEFLSIVARSPVLQTLTERPIRIADLGCGNAYLSFAAYHYLNSPDGTLNSPDGTLNSPDGTLNSPGRTATLIGVDTQPAIIERNRAIARELGWDDVAFECCANIDFAPRERPHLVFALHACDTASDEAIAQAVKWGSPLIAAATCCHHHLQTQLEHSDGARGAFAAVRRQGLLRERLGDVLTDAFRVSILESLGYKTAAIEFVSPEHTPRNVLIRAEKLPGAHAARALREYLELRDYWGVVPHLATLLADELTEAQSRLRVAGGSLPVRSVSRDR